MDRDSQRAAGLGRRQCGVDSLLRLRPLVQALLFKEPKHESPRRCFQGRLPVVVSVAP